MVNKQWLSKDAVTQLENIGINPYDGKSHIEEIKEPGQKWVTVVVEIALPGEVDLDLPKNAFGIADRRGFETVMADLNFIHSESTNQHILQFTISHRLPDGVPEFSVPSGFYQTYADVCWFAGNEAIPEGYNSETHDVDTIPVAGYLPTDLGWILPHRSLYPIIDALGRLNDAIFVGLMKEALIYTLD